MSDAVAGFYGMLAGMDEFRGYQIKRQSWDVAGRSFQMIMPVDLDALLDLPIVQERFEQDEYLPYWAQPWPSAVLLANVVLQGENGRGRAAVELGCGVGLVSLAAAMAGWAVVASDYDEDAVAFAQYNAELTGVTLAGAEKIDYRRPLNEPRFDLVLGSDLLYEQKKIQPVLAWVASALNTGGRALICDPNRAAADETPKFARMMGLDIRVEPVVGQMPDGQSVSGRIWELKRQ